VRVDVVSAPSNPFKHSAGTNITFVKPVAAVLGPEATSTAAPCRPNELCLCFRASSRGAVGLDARQLMARESPT
jgi:hypothetical protein